MSNSSQMRQLLESLDQVSEDSKATTSQGVLRNAAVNNDGVLDLMELVQAAIDERMAEADSPDGKANAVASALSAVAGMFYKHKFTMDDNGNMVMGDSIKAHYARKRAEDDPVAVNKKKARDLAWDLTLEYRDAFDSDGNGSGVSISPDTLRFRKNNTAIIFNTFAEANAFHMNDEDKAVAKENAKEHARKWLAKKGFDVKDFPEGRNDKQLMVVINNEDLPK